MKKVFIFIICVLFLSACAARPPRDFKREIATSLQPAQLRYSFGVKPDNLKEISKCPGQEASIRFINSEKIDKDLVILGERWCAYGDNAGRERNGCFLNPREVTDQIIEYLKESYRQCRVSVDPNASKVIRLSFPTEQNTYINDFNSSVVMKVNVNIPELNKSFTISTTQASFELHNAVAYAIHDMAWQIINDPTIQDYLLCR
jgi:hypothetical protein